MGGLVGGLGWRAPRVAEGRTRTGGRRGGGLLLDFFTLSGPEVFYKRLLLVVVAFVCFCPLSYISVIPQR